MTITNSIFTNFIAEPVQPIEVNGGLFLIAASSRAEITISNS